MLLNIGKRDFTLYEIPLLTALLGTIPGLTCGKKFQDPVSSPLMLNIELWSREVHWLRLLEKVAHIVIPKHLRFSASSRLSGVLPRVSS